MKHLIPLDFTEAAYGSDRLKSYITVWSDDTCRQVDWIQAGILRMVRLPNGAFQVNGSASVEIAQNGRDPDGVNLFRFTLGGVQFENMFLNSVILTGWIDGGSSRDFRVPRSTRVKRKAAPYVPPVNAKLYNELRGLKVEITLCTVFEDV